MQYSFVRVRVKILTSLWHRNSINHFTGVSHNICPLTGEMYVTVCLVVFRLIAECIHRVLVLRQTTNSSLRQNNRKLMICWTWIGPCSTWYAFELQDTYMYLFLDHDWINLSKPWVQYFSMPLTFLQECEDSTGIRWNGTGIHRNPQEWDWIPQE